MGRFSLSYHLFSSLLWLTHPVFTFCSCLPVLLLSLAKSSPLGQQEESELPGGQMHQGSGSPASSIATADNATEHGRAATLLAPCRGSGQGQQKWKASSLQNSAPKFLNTNSDSSLSLIVRFLSSSSPDLPSGEKLTRTGGPTYNYSLLADIFLIIVLL